MKTVDLAIEGMGCGGCVSKVSGALKKLDGVTIESVAVGSARATIDPTKIRTSDLVGALARVGFEAREASSPDGPTSR